PIGKSEKSDALVRAMVSVGKELRLQIVAEGVETQEQADYLLGLGVGYAQGWLYAPAMAGAKCGDWLTENANAADTGANIPSAFMGLN
ncbi:MAG: EAL domain-containing protein, partial [Burkholderiales bacterium]|nr:EAL domain-containing protein [Burkholderiales bacterium]